MPLVQHTSGADGWRTPDPILERVRSVFGGIIDVDPASSVEANATVRAQQIFTERNDGLAQAWYLDSGVYQGKASVYCNPPGGKFPKGHVLGGKSKTALFWDKLMQEAVLGHVSHAIFMCFSISSLQVLQGRGARSVTSFPVCIPAKRLAFIDPTGEDRDGPSHANAIIYVPGHTDRTSEFAAAFWDVGGIMMPY